MNTRKTSIECYNEIKANGLLSKMRFKVYEALFKIGKPSTAREIYQTMNLAKMEATRLTELRNLGLIYESNTRTCKVTGRKSIEWELTDKLPDDKKLLDHKKASKKYSGAELDEAYSRGFKDGMEHYKLT